MKKLLSLALICFAFTGIKAQTINVTNNACESVDLIIHYSPSGTCGTPDNVVPSGGGVITVAGVGGFYTNTLPSGWSFATFTETCGGTMYAVGNSCSWLTPPIPMTVTFSPTCTPCAPITATWTNTGGGSANLTFN